MRDGGPPSPAGLESLPGGSECHQYGNRHGNPYFPAGPSCRLGTLLFEERPGYVDRPVTAGLSGLVMLEFFQRIKDVAHFTITFRPKASHEYVARSPDGVSRVRPPRLPGQQSQG